MLLFDISPSNWYCMLLFDISPSNWYCMMLLKISSRKNTRWWLLGAEKRNQGVVKASSRCSSLVADTIDNVFRYGDTVGSR